MKPELLSWLCCPKCGNAELMLQVASEHEGEIESGALCCIACHARFPIVRSIPRFVSSDNYAYSFGLEWNRFRRTQLDSYSGTTISRDRFLRQTGWSPDILAGSAVLDAGCGAGRFAEVALSMGAHVFAFDYSEAVDACWLNLSTYPNFHVVQADIYAIPFKSEQFDFVCSFGVLMGTPDVRAAFMALVPLLKSPSGRLAVDVYEKSWRTWPNPKYWLRPFTTRLPTEFLFKAVELAVPLLLPLSRTLGRVPKKGSLLKRIVPIADYKGVYPLDDTQLREWALLDTFDMLSPRYDQPQTSQTLRAWFEQAGLSDVEILKTGHLVGRGCRR